MRQSAHYQIIMYLSSIFQLIHQKKMTLWGFLTVFDHQHTTFMHMHIQSLLIYIYSFMIIKVLLFSVLFIFTLTFKSQLREDDAKTDIDLNCGFTKDFSDFLAKNNYQIWGFDRPDINCAAYGGKESSSEQIQKVPIIFIHGNSDIGFGDGHSAGYHSWQTGFRSLATYFGSQGYSKAELYTTTWGNANIQKAELNNHAKEYIMMMRAFVEAVLAYTKAPYVNLISHSMGVTIARKVAQGGIAEDHKVGKYEVGPSLKHRIKNFVGIAGGNLGLTACFNLQEIPTCSSVDGFAPGEIPTFGPSKYLKDLNKDPAAEAQNVYAIWSKYDEVIGGECVVWGKVTCRIPGQKQEVVKRSLEWSHLNLRDKTGEDILKLFS